MRFKSNFIFVLALIFILVSNCCIFASADIEKKGNTISDYKDILDNTAYYLKKTVTEPNFGSIGGEWAVLGLARYGEELPDSFVKTYLSNIKNVLDESKGILHNKKYTEYSRGIVALSSIGVDPANIYGYDILINLSDYENTIWQGLNGPIWALIALDTKAYPIRENKNAKVQATRDMYIENIISAQKSDGGFGLNEKTGSDVDITAMALYSLAKYKNKPNVNVAIEKGLSYLSNVQCADGGFTSYGSENVESVAQVIVAMCTLGITQDDARFVKNGCTPLDSLLSFYIKDKGFFHVYDGSGSNQMATEQAFYALVAYDRFVNGKTALFDMSDVALRSANEYTNPKDVNDSGNVSGLENKNPAVKVLPIVYNEKSFLDTQNKKIIELAKRGMVSGRTADQFAPKGTMTRAEFAAITVKSLGLDLQNTIKFDDVTADKWYFGYIATANSFGIVNGINDTKFNPNGNITREEAATMVRRAALLCGLDKNYSDVEVRDVLAGFTDYIKVSSWATESMCFCYDNAILDDSAIMINPKEIANREEIAEMLYNMLSKAELI